MDVLELVKMSVAVAVPITVAWISLSNRLTKMETILDLVVTGKLQLHNPKEDDE